MIINNQENLAISSEKKLLLQAALLSGEASLKSWQQWRESIDIENLDTESYHLLPLLYRSLSAQEVIDPHIGRLKGVYRRTWVENQVLFQKLTVINDCFQKHEIQTLLLKDAALNLYYYRDNGLRMIPNLEILINPSNALMGINLLQKLGWEPIGKIPKINLQFSQSMSFKNSVSQYLILRWHLFADGLPEKAENDLWENATITKLGESEMYIFSPTDQMLSICGALKNQLTSSSKIADAATIINDLQNQIDWHKLVIKAQEYHLVDPLKKLIHTLREILNISIPSENFTEMINLPISRFESREYQIMNQKNNSLLERFNLRYYQYARMMNHENRKSHFLGFAKYLQYLWELENLWQVPYQVIIRGIRRLIKGSLANR
jgi:hypothetical protein